MSYPFELEWMEGGQLDHVVRILNGQQIYVAPSLEFIPYIYTPLYNYLAAAISLITGVGFFPLRLISFISTLGIFVYLYMLLKKITGSKYIGVVSAGIYAASFKVCGQWYDTGRVDSLFLFLFLASMYYLITGLENRKYYLISGILAGLSFLTKQSVIFMILPVLIYFIVKKDKKGWIYFIGFSILTLLVSIYFNVITNGWYWFWNFGLPATHHWNYKYIYAFWLNDLMEPLGISMAFGLIGFVFLYYKKNNFLLLLLTVIGCLVDSWLLRLHYGGYLNAIMPAVLSISIAAPIGLYYFSENAKVDSVKSWETNRLLVYLLILVQFIVLNYNPLQAIPTSKDLEGGKKFLKEISKFKGDIFVPCHSFIPTYSGKKSMAHAVVIHDLLISNSSLKVKLLNEIKDNFKNKRYEAVILNSEWEMEELDKYYDKAGSIFSENEQSFFTVIGKTRPDIIYLPKK